MSAIGDVARRMREASVDPGLIGDMLQAFADSLASVQPRVDPAAERRRAWDRQRKAEKRAQARPVESPVEMSGGNPVDTAEEAASASETPPRAQPLIPTTSDSLHSQKKDPPMGGPKKDPKRRKSEMAADWQPDEPTRAAGVALLGERVASVELDKFRDWAVNQAPRKDWNASFRNWCRKAVELSRSAGPPGANGHRRPTGNVFLNIARELAEDEHESGNLFDHAEPRGIVEVIPPDRPASGSSGPGRPAAQPDRDDAGWDDGDLRRGRAFGR